MRSLLFIAALLGLGACASAPAPASATASASESATASAAESASASAPASGVVSGAPLRRREPTSERAALSGVPAASPVPDLPLEASAPASAPARASSVPVMKVAVGAPLPAMEQLVWYRGAAPAEGTGYGLYWWGTFCKPCKAILPELMAGAAARGLPLVAVSRDSAAKLDAFFAEHEGAFPEPVAYDPIPSPVAHAQGAWVLPSLVLVDPAGDVARVIVGVTDLRAWLAEP